MMTTAKQDTSKKGRLYNLTETQKATEMGLSASFLAKDRMRAEPTVDFKRFGRSIRYASDTDGRG